MMRTAKFFLTLFVFGVLSKATVGDVCDTAVYKELNQPGRSEDDTYQTVDDDTRCDRDELPNGWYRFVGAGGIAMSDTCIPAKRCRTHASGYLVGGHPTFAEGTVTRKVCYHWGSDCCFMSNNIQVRNCGDFYVYGLQGTPECKLRYCTNPRAIPPTPPAVDGGWSAWSGWGACSKTCGGGEKRQTRTCTNPPPSGGGQNCQGESTKTEACNEDPCAVDGGWAAWSAWSDCSKTCGGGTQKQTRTCTNPPPSSGGDDCDGDSEKTKACNEEPCVEDVDGGWTKWSKWGACSVTCGKGKKQRTRTCTNPPPSGEGKKCDGNDKKKKKCKAGKCSIPLEYLGCFKEGDPLSVPVLLEDFTGTYSPSQGKKVTQACAKLAKAKGWDYFASGGTKGLSCYSGPNAGNTYDDGGVGKKCSKNNLGKKGDIAVYKIK